MTCSTCKHYFAPRWDDRGACMNLAVSLPLFVQPTKCGEYKEDLVKVEAEHQAATREAARPKRGPEVWLSEQTLMQLRPQSPPRSTWHDRTDR